MEFSFSMDYDDKNEEERDEMRGWKIFGLKY